MKLLIPAIWYRARAIIERSWGWSPIEEAILLNVRETPATTSEIARKLRIERQIAESAVNRMMRFGLIEVRLEPYPSISITAAADAHIMSGRPLPERNERRDIRLNLVFEKLGKSVFRSKDVTLIGLDAQPQSDRLVIGFPNNDADDLETAIQQRARDVLSKSLRPGETFAGVRNLKTFTDRRYVEIDLAKARDGILPEGASDDLRKQTVDLAKSRNTPKLNSKRDLAPPSIGATVELSISPDQFIFGGSEHLKKIVDVVDKARSDIFVLSTFVARQDDPKAPQGQDAVWAALERACERGVRVHLFLGSSLDEDGKHVDALQALSRRLRKTGGTVMAPLETMHSHAKLLIADDGADSGVALIGSCNWLQSPFLAHELSVELRNDVMVAKCLETLKAITSLVPSARGSRDHIQAMEFALNRARPRLLTPNGENEKILAQATLLGAPDHLPLLRRVAHDEAEHRFVCVTHKLGAPMVSNLLDPAQSAGERIEDVRAFFSVPAGPVKKRHTRAEKERLSDKVHIGSPARNSPMLHAKILLWDNDDLVVTSFNWGSQSASSDNPLDEIGIHIKGDGLAEKLHAMLIERAKYLDSAPG